MSVYSEARTYFGQTSFRDDLDVISIGFNIADETLKLVKLLKELNLLNIEKAILENETAFIFKYLLIVDLSHRGHLYGMEFPLHRPSLYISKYFDVVEENLTLFTNLREIIYNNRFHKTGLFGVSDHPLAQKQLQEFAAEVREPLLIILEKLKTGFQDQGFKDGIKAEQKYSSKMKIKYLEFGQKMIDSSKEFNMIEFTLHTRDFSFDNYISGSICTVNFDTVLNDLSSDRNLFIDMCCKEFADDFLGCLWKINHNLTRGFYLDFIFCVKKKRKQNSVDRLESFLKNSVYRNKNFKLIRSGSRLICNSSSCYNALSSVTKYVMMDTIFNLKIEGHKTLGRVGFKNIAANMI
ncbi:MAG: hypothetical protein ACTIMQ_06035 [Acinetobacter guillouiae]